MKPLACLLLLSSLLLTLTSTAQSAETSGYQTGKLVDLRRYSTGSGAARAQGSFCLAVQVGDIAYLARHQAYWRWSYEPTDLVVGDLVEVRIKGNEMYVRRLKGGDLKTAITRRERIGKEPPTCALPVTMN